MSFWDYVNPLRAPGHLYGIGKRILGRGQAFPDYVAPGTMPMPRGGVGLNVGLGGGPGDFSRPGAGGFSPPGPGMPPVVDTRGGMGRPSGLGTFGGPSQQNLSLAGIGERLKGGFDRLTGWVGENPEAAGQIGGGIASTIGAIKEGRARDREFEAHRQDVEWAKEQEEKRLRRKREAMERMRAQWDEWGWT